MANRAILVVVLIAALLILRQTLFVPAPTPPPPNHAPEGPPAAPAPEAHAIDLQGELAPWFIGLVILMVILAGLSNLINTRQAVPSPLWKAIMNTASGAAFVSGLAAMVFWEYYDATRPRLPEPDIGRIYRLFTHGSAVYLTQGEKSWLWSLMRTFGISVVITVVIKVFVLRQRYNER
jgi:hypothetical protein